jgi:AmmeMemoRadiSam system protein A
MSIEDAPTSRDSIAGARGQLSSDDRRFLLELARRTIESAVRGADPPEPDPRALPTSLRAPHGAFVTLTERGELRGCMGRLDFERAVWANVMLAAASSALDDPRFPPVRASELPLLALEVSVLEQPVDLPDVSEFRPAEHGIIIEHGRRRGLLLPQVARERGWDSRTTLENVCWKAGLSADAWRDRQSRLMVFRAEVFSESERDVQADAE